VRQLITRIDEQLHQRLKSRAAAEGRSVNALVTDLLAAGVAADQRTVVRQRAKAADLLVEPRLDRRPPSRKRAIALTKGAGRAASRALQAERSRR
jgi:plasmid stability protein